MKELRENVYYNKHSNKKIYNARRNVKKKKKLIEKM